MVWKNVHVCVCGLICEPNFSRRVWKRSAGRSHPCLLSMERAKKYRLYTEMIMNAFLNGDHTTATQCDRHMAPRVVPFGVPSSSCVVDSFLRLKKKITAVFDDKSQLFRTRPREKTQKKKWRQKDCNYVGIATHCLAIARHRRNTAKCAKEADTRDDARRDPRNDEFFGFFWQKSRDRLSSQNGHDTR